MDPQDVFCPNRDCPARGHCGRGNIVRHGRQPQRYRCKECGHTFSPTNGTVFYRAHVERRLIVVVLTLLAYGCPPAAIEAAFGLQARTVRRWQEAAGQHCERVHQELLQQPQALGQVQADELRVRWQRPRGRGGVWWVAMAIAVPTRLWLGGVVSAHRDKALIRAVAQLIRACAARGPLLLVSDGLKTYIGAFQRAFRDPARTGEAKRPRLVAWPQVVIGQVVKQYGLGQRGQRCVTGVVRRTVQGSAQLMGQLLRATQDKGGAGGVLNTAYIERLNGTFRARLAALVRRTRGLARRQTMLHAGLYLVGTVYNFCSLHDSLAAGGVRCTPAMAAGLTDHVWSVQELLWHRVPPAPWAPPKRRGRRPKALQQLIQRWAT